MSSDIICNFADLGILVSILIFAGVSVFLFLKADAIGIAKKHLLTIWFVKLGFTFLYLQIFTSYYGSGEALQGDSYKFQEDGRVLNQIADKDFSTYFKILIGVSGDEAELHQNQLKNTVIWAAGENGDQINDNRLMIRINSVIHFFSFNNSYVHSLIFSAFTLIGLILIFKSFQQKVSNPTLFFYIICLLPSIGFWGSSITKESLMILTCGMIIYSMHRFAERSTDLKTLLILALGIFFSMINKPYVGLIMLPFILLFFSGRYFNWRKSILYFSTILAILCTFLLTIAPKEINLLDKITTKQRDLINLAKGGIFFITDSSFCAFDYRYLENFDTSDNVKIKVLAETSGEYKLFGKDEFYPFTIQPSDSLYDLYFMTAPSTSYFESTEIKNNGFNLIKSIPGSIWNVWVRPFPNDPGGSLKYASFLQNILLISFAVFVLIRIQKPSGEIVWWLYFLFGCALIITLVIGWTTPVFGAIARYKVPADLFVICGLFLLLKPLKFFTK